MEVPDRIDHRIEALEQVQQHFGFLPNMFLEMSNNPVVVRAFLATLRELRSGRLTPREREVVMLAISAWNDCHYCVAAHSRTGETMGVSAQELRRVSAVESPLDPWFQALTSATWTVLEKRGWLDGGDLKTLGEAGIDRSRLYEIIAYVGLMTISNFINHVHGTQLDDVFLGSAENSLGGLPGAEKNERRPQEASAPRFHGPDRSSLSAKPPSLKGIAGFAAANGTSTRRPESRGEDPTTK